MNSNYGFEYYITFVDTYSRHTWIYLLKSKSETVTTQFITQVEKLLNKSVKMFQTDGGTEYKQLKEFFNKKGIIHRTTCLYTSEQNVIIERKHRHIVETGLSLLTNSSLPKIFWPEAFCIAVNLINRLPT